VGGLQSWFQRRILIGVSCAFAPGNCQRTVLLYLLQHIIYHPTIDPMQSGLITASLNEHIRWGRLRTQSRVLYSQPVHHLPQFISSILVIECLGQFENYLLAHNLRSRKPRASPPPLSLSVCCHWKVNLINIALISPYRLLKQNGELYYNFKIRRDVNLNRTECACYVTVTYTCCGL
jgi:hypothetical protein